MYQFVRYSRFAGILGCLYLVVGLTVAWAQTGQLPAGISVTGKRCTPDQECKSDSITFTDSTQATAYAWTFGDGSTGTGSAAKHVYQTANTYNVTLIRTVNGQPATISFTLNINTPPPSFIKWRTDTTICEGQTITLDPYASRTQSNYNYLWYPKGDTTQTLQVDSSGCYSVEVTDPNTGCSYQDRINVDVCGEKKQSQGSKWYFGNNAGLEFKDGSSPTPLTDGKLSTIEGSSSIANTKGQLLFYTDGTIIYDKDGNPMKSIIGHDTTAVTLGGNTHSTESALIVPKPTCRGCEYLYYVYTTSEVRGSKQLTYSIVDMRLNKGKGAVTNANIPVTTTPSTEQSASVRNDRDSTYWVITHDYGTNQFRIIHLTKDDNKQVTTYKGGQVIDSLTQAEGYVKIGPTDTTSTNNSERPMAVVLPGPPQNSIDLYTFNDSTGTLSFKRTIQLGPAPPKAYGVEFSPDGKSLYVTMLADTSANGSQNGASYIVKYDLSQTSDSLLTQSRTVVDSSTTRQYGALQVGSDGKIYVAVKGSTSLGVIENPNATALDSLQFNSQGQSLGGKVSQLGLPNLVANFNDPSSGPGLSHADTCANSPTTFQIGPNCPKLKETYTLTFGDGTAPKSFTSAQPQMHTYTTPGTYFASLHIVTKRSDGGICKDTLIRDTLTIVATPDAFTLADQTVCGKDVSLKIPVTAKQYVWVVNGRVASRQQEFVIPKTRYGFYTVIALAANGGCYQGDTLQVIIKKPPTLDLGPDSVFCQGTTYNLTVPQATWTTFQWSNGVTTKTNAITRAGTYTLVAQNAEGCINSDTITLRQLPKPVLRATLTNPTTCTSANGILDLTATPVGSYTFTIGTSTTALTTNTFRQTDLAAGTYAVIVIDERTCRTDSSFSLKNPDTPVVDAGQNTTFCTGTQPIRLTGNTPGNGYWLGTGVDSTGFFIPTGVLSGSTNQLTYNVLRNGCLGSDTITVAVNPSPQASAGPDVAFCANERVPIIATGTAAASFRWSDGTTGLTLRPQNSGRYIVTASLNGCNASDTVAVTVQAIPQVSITPQAYICPGDNESVILAANSPDQVSYYWPQLGDSTRTVRVSRSALYAVLVTNAAGCLVRDTVAVSDRCEPRLLVPDAFTPNSDGVNDTFEVFPTYTTDYDIKIFNRWGEIIFASDNAEQKWDGTYRGALYPSMLYPYVISYKSQYFPERPKAYKRGSILLIR